MRILQNVRDEIGFVEQCIRRLADQRGALQILEAGCGRRWHCQLDGVDYELTGLDLDEAALVARQADQADLTHAIVGDLRTAELEPGKYDVIYNACVLEHIQGAEMVLDNFVRWLRPGGLIIIRVPDRDSVH